ncbi:hypothetical protein [Rossellomorea sp. LjRoot5]|uniref:hypothetical protein n=1 Tax=Rossellomorea sp. LjRoot5 TaxID=3342331 RepID=UPI003ED022B6
MEPINIHYLIKFGKYEHMRALQRGRIRSLPLGYYQKMERESKELDTAKRYDGFEATSELIQPEVLMERGEKMYLFDPQGKLLSDKLASAMIGPGKMSTGNMRSTPVFCIFAIHSELIEDYKRGNVTTLVDPRVEEFGGYALVINDYKEFMYRINKVFEEFRGRYKAVPGIVEYVDTNTFHGHYGFFRKPIEFSFQKELRIVFDGISIDVEHLIVFELGDISDISTLMSYNQFKNHFKIQVNGLEFNPFVPYKLQQPILERKCNQ